MRWRVVRTETHDAYLNMALDEAGSEAVKAGRSPPTIRFYRWKPSAVSIGYFQGLRDEVNIEACRKLGIDYIRRRTGGGAVYHDYNGEITYSVIAPQDLFPKNIVESYRVICGWIVNALEHLGIKAEFKPINDILVGGKKISGSAQTRRGGILLQHGTLLYDLDLETMFTVLNVSSIKITDKMIKSAEERVTCILKNKEVGTEEIQDALIDAFTSGKDYEFGAWRREEAERARELAEARYRTEEWNHLR